MDPKHIGLLDLAERRLAWTDRRLAVLARNVANADTPGFKPHDLQPFTAALDNANSVRPMRTQPNHLPGTTGTATPGDIVDRTQMQSPNGNAVALDDQLVKVADTQATHSLVVTIYRKYLSMFGMALGRAGSS
jgi:flagellar basal-body rod protein FlgB